MLKFWDLRENVALATALASRDGEWLAITPDGFFAASGKRADQMLSVVRGLNITTIDQVHQSLFNPDLVREALGGRSGTAR